MVKRKADWTPTMEQRAGLPASSAVSVLHRVIYGLVPAGAHGSIPGACSVSRMSALAIGPNWRIGGPLRFDHQGPRRRLLRKRKRDPELAGLLRYEPLRQQHRERCGGGSVTERAWVILSTSAAWQGIINNQAFSRANDPERECRIHNARAPPDLEKKKTAPPIQRGAVVSRPSSTGVIYMNKPSLQAVPEPDGGTQDAAVTTPQLDPFDPANLRLSQSFTETVGVKKLLTTVPVRKPSPQEFVRVHPSSEYRENFPIIELKDDREEFIVTTALVPELAGEFVTKTLYLAINRQGTPFFWPVRLPSPDGKDMNWWRSAREAAAFAMSHWIRTKANMSLGAYEIYRAESAMSEPEWPPLGFWDLIKIAFRDHLIDRIDHPVIKRLRGQR